jgi:hypothetical protein
MLQIQPDGQRLATRIGHAGGGSVAVGGCGFHKEACARGGRLHVSCKLGPLGDLVSAFDPGLALVSLSMSYEPAR